MNYITSQNVIDRIGNDKAAQLTTDAGSTPDTVKIDAIIAEKEGRANSYISSRVSVPVSASDYPHTYAALKGAVMDMVLCALHSLRSPAPTDIKGSHDRAIEWLKGVADGSVSLPDAGLVSNDGQWNSETKSTSREDMI